MPKYHYFCDDEVEGLSEKLVEQLDHARSIAGIPFFITEGLASGGSHVKDTAHQRGLAVDLRCNTSRARFIMVRALLFVGFRRIGIYDKHVHVDIDESLPQDVIWVGESK